MTLIKTINKQNELNVVVGLEHTKKIKKKINKQNELKVIIGVGPHPDEINFFLFGKEFIQNNKDKCKIIINGRDDFELK